MAKASVDVSTNSSSGGWMKDDLFPSEDPDEIIFKGLEPLDPDGYFGDALKDYFDRMCLPLP